MIAIFKTIEEAQAYADKVHEYLLANRPQYNAVKWADPVESADGLSWWVKQPIEEFEDKWETPIDSTVELVNSEITLPLPEFGQECLIDTYYLHKGDIVKCRQTHNRMIYEPKDTPALFSFFRDNSDQLEWIEGEQVEVGWMRIYEGVKYEVVQAHQTQSDWTPNNTPTLWRLYLEEKEPEVNEWVQPTGAHDAYNIGDQVLFNGNTYESLINANVWSPSVYPAGWEQI